MTEGVDPTALIDLLSRLLGWVTGLGILLLGSMIGFFVAWQRRQDSRISDIGSQLTEYKEAAAYLMRIGEKNIPDAWKEADKSKDLLIEKLTTLCLRFCEKRVTDGCLSSTDEFHEKSNGLT